jgi:hypothetical protein
MTDYVNTIGFIFNKAKTIIKCDKRGKYHKYCCSNNYCVNNLYKICIFKLEKENFISSSLNICTSNDNAWEIFKNNVSTLLDAFFIISVTKNTTAHSFNAKFIKCTKCECCDAILIYFKFNIIPFNFNVTSCSTCIPITCGSNVPVTSSIIPNYWPSSDPQDNNKISYNSMANFAYKCLKSTTYTNIRFFYNDKYASKLCFTEPSVC